jgi:pimeloyl-ACP methyl ester carboxylesterase
MQTIAFIIGTVLALIGLAGLILAFMSARIARRVEAAVPPLGKFIEIDGCRLHYLDEGTGPTLVLIHGLAGQMRNFTYALRDILNKSFRVIIVERPGSGYSTRPPEAPANINAQAAILAHFIEKLGLERPILVGHSLGGAISLAIALNHPERVGGLALLAPLTHPQEKVPTPFEGLAVASPLVRFVIAWTLAVPSSILNAKAALDAIFGPQAVPADFRTKGGGLLSLRPRSYINASKDLVGTLIDLPDMPARYASLNVPAGVIFGTGDRLLAPAQHGKALAAKIAGLDYEEIDGGGHMILAVSAERCAALIARVAERVAGAAKNAA